MTRQPVNRATWRPVADPDACDHAERAIYLEALPGWIVRRCRACGAELAPVEARCVRVLAIGRRCMAPGRYGGLCRAHAPRILEAFR